MEHVAAAARELRDLEQQQRAGAARLAQALLSAHQAGFSWAEVARAADLASGETARTRAYGARDPKEVPPSLRWRREHGSTPPPISPATGVSVTEAASQLGVSRKTVYAWIRNGKLASTTDEAGRTRVILEENEVP